MFGGGFFSGGGLLFLLQLFRFHVLQTQFFSGFGCFLFRLCPEDRCLLFRIGTLEYELCAEEGIRVISLHIPSDADLSPAALRNSIRSAKEILERTFPDWADLPWYCHSWLLSPDLKTLLPETSKILYFQSLFHLESDDDEGEFKLWAYGREDIPNEELPEQTTLQRNLKSFLLAGNRFHSGKGTLKESAFR